MNIFLNWKRVLLFFVEQIKKKTKFRIEVKTEGNDIEMITAISIFASVVIITILIKTINKRNWKLLYTAYGSEDYFKIISMLKEQRINYKVEVPFGGFDSRINRFKDNTQYNIYVRKNQEHLAITNRGTSRPCN